MSYSN